MKKTSLKGWSVLALIILLVSTFAPLGIMNVEAASKAPKSFTAKSEKNLDGYIANYHFGKKINSAGGYVYCNDIHKGTPHGETMTLVGEAPAGIAYILANGYPKKSITGNSDFDYYITQSAVWWYIDDTTGSNNLSASFKSGGSDPHNLRQHVKKLVADAKKVKSYDSSSLDLTIKSKEMTLSSDGKYYESKPIGVEGENLSGNYTISLSNAPSGTKILNSSNESVKTLPTTKKFKIRVPASSVKSEKINITAAVKATGSIAKAYEYKSSDSSVQNVYGSALYPETSSLTKKLTVTLKSSEVSIEKVDSDTGKTLAGAKFTLKNSAGKTVATWTSTTSAYTIKNLANGTYTLKETEAPKGYKIMEETKKFTIDDNNRSISIKVKNEKVQSLVKIIKVDKTTGDPLAGAKFGLYDSKGKEITTWTSTINAHTIKNLANGTYTLKELEAPKGYKIVAESVKFTIDDDHKDITLKMENQPIEKIAHIIKMDRSTDTPLAGSRLVVKNAKREVVADFVSTEEPYTLVGLEDGEYTVEEVEAPAGYLKSDEIYKFTLSDEAPTATVTVDNYPEVEVPYTASNSSLMNIMLGFILLLSGVGFVYYNGKKQEQK